MAAAREGFLTGEQREVLKMATQSTEILSSSPKSPPWLMAEHQIKASVGERAKNVGIAVRHVRRSHSGKFVRVKKEDLKPSNRSCIGSWNRFLHLIYVVISMGRVKLKIKRLENISNRQVTFSKRRNGILMKAKELSVLCDIDIILLIFSPIGKPTSFSRQRSNIDEVIAKFARLTPQERAKRKLESLEALKKTSKKLDHDVNIQDFTGASSSEDGN